MKEGEEEPKGQQRNGCDMSHEIEIKSRAQAWLQWSRLVMVFESVYSGCGLGQCASC